MKARILLAALAALVLAFACVDFSDNTVDATWCQNHPGQCANGAGGGNDGGTCTPGQPSTCALSNEFGTCGGIAFCTDAGVLGACSAKTPTMDVCDGQDNDCDGTIDNPKIACTCPGTGGQKEICSNYKDDDCDGVTDCPGEPISFRTFGPATNGDLVIQAMTSTDAGEFIGGVLSSGQFDFVDSGAPAGLSNGSTSSFVVRLNPGGGPALWQTTLLTKSVTSTYFDESSGGLFVAGTYGNGLGADAGCGDAPGGTGAVIYRLDPTNGAMLGGQFVCTTSSLGTFRDARIAGTNADGGIVIAGTFDQELVFYPSLKFLFADGGFDGYVAVLSPGLDVVRQRQAFGAAGDERVQAAALDQNSSLWLGGTGTSAFSFFRAAVPLSSAGAFVAVVDSSLQGLGAFTAGSAVTSIMPVTATEAIIGGGMTAPSTVGGCSFPGATAPSSYLLRTTFASSCRWAHAFYGSNGTYVTDLTPEGRLVAGGSYSSSLAADFDAGTIPPTSGAALWLGVFQPDSGTPAVVSGYTGATAFTPSAASGRTIAANYQGSFSFLGHPVPACATGCGMLIHVNP